MALVAYPTSLPSLKKSYRPLRGEAFLIRSASPNATQLPVHVADTVDAIDNLLADVTNPLLVILPPRAFSMPHSSVNIGFVHIRVRIGECPPRSAPISKATAIHRRVRQPLSPPRSICRPPRRSEAVGTNKSKPKVGASLRARRGIGYRRTRDLTRPNKFPKHFVGHLHGIQRFCRNRRKNFERLIAASAFAALARRGVRNAARRPPPARRPTRYISRVVARFFGVNLV